MYLKKSLNIWCGIKVVLIDGQMQNSLVTHLEGPE